MTLKHLSDDVIQQYALEAGTEPGAQEHLQQCPACRAKMEMYRNMAAAFRELPAPSFSFDAHALVMARLQPAALRPARRIAGLVLYVALAALLLPAAAAFYLFRHDVAQLFSGAVSMLTGLAATTILTILVMQGLDMLQSYRKKIHKILQH
ncbi:hypothetical protein [Chitinophaga sp.]|uniref:anti-sigma factor family protein n=1 Tax=Chitinophaga sp. TaxID=1869181 RepID=UPI0031D86C8A